MLIDISACGDDSDPPLSAAQVTAGLPIVILNALQPLQTGDGVAIAVIATK